MGISLANGAGCLQVVDLTSRKAKLYEQVIRRRARFEHRANPGASGQ